MRIKWQIKILLNISTLIHDFHADVTCIQYNIAANKVLIISKVQKFIYVNRAYVKLISNGINGMSFMPFCHFLPLFARSLYTALRVFNRANTARRAQERKSQVPGRCAEKRKWRKKLYGGKSERRWEIKIKKERLRCKLFFNLCDKHKSFGVCFAAFLWKMMNEWNREMKERNVQISENEKKNLKQNDRANANQHFLLILHTHSCALWSNTMSKFLSPIVNESNRRVQ